MFELYTIERKSLNGRELRDDKFHPRTTFMVRCVVTHSAKRCGDTKNKGEQINSHSPGVQWQRRRQPAISWTLIAFWLFSLHPFAPSPSPSSSSSVDKSEKNNVYFLSASFQWKLHMVGSVGGSMARERKPLYFGGRAAGTASAGKFLFFIWKRPCALWGPTMHRDGPPFVFSVRRFLRYYGATHYKNVPINVSGSSRHQRYAYVKSNKFSLRD